jgi:hypothetical protein
MQSAAPLLVIDRIEADAVHSHRVSAQVRLGGRSESVSLDLSTPIVAALEELPDGLAHHRPAQDAVIGAMMRQYQGESVALPMDLSEVVRQASVPWPMRAPVAQVGDASDGSAESTQVALKQIERADGAPDLITVRLDFAGIPTVVIVDCSAGVERPLRFRFAEGVHPWSLAPAEQRLLLESLVGALPERSA